MLKSVTISGFALLFACGLGGCDQEAKLETAFEIQETSAVPARPYTLFESGQVRPLALSPDRTTLFAVNTPDGQLEVFDVHPGGLLQKMSIPVGLEPVAVAARTNDEVWVINHLSDSVSIVRIDAQDPSRSRVIRTLLVGDEPRDIVFAGPGRSRAFITTAHRGQNSPIDPQLTTPGVGRADVWVFDSGNLGTSLGGSPLTILTLFADTPRALAVSPNGQTVYAAAFASGSRTAIVGQLAAPVGPELLGGPPNPYTNHQGIPRPTIQGLIVKFDGTHWIDEIGRSWDDKIKFNLPDKDVFVIDAAANPPAPLAGPAGFYSGVGTTLFNMIVNPVSGKVYVSNTEARNEVRFEGPGTFTGKPTVRGHIAESRITVLGAAGSVTPRHLNKHINYSTCCAPLPNAENERSLAQPVEMALTADGSTLYVAAFGSSKIGIYNTAQLESDTFQPDLNKQITVSGGGPTGIVLDETQGRLYVLTRFDNSISIINTATRTETQHLSMHNPEPPSIVTGRRFLYDAKTTSSHGDSSCASCHIFGDMDHIAWDLGNPDGNVSTVLGPFRFTFGLSGIELHPMKGPMVTQSLRGMDNHGPMHWRGDRTGGSDRLSFQPNTGSFDEVEAFRQFNPAFLGLVGRNNQLTDSEMQDFTEFALRLTYPPNPVRALDNSLTPDQKDGKFIFSHIPAVGPNPCSFCHVLDSKANSQYGVPTPGFFGTDGAYVIGEFNLIKIPHLRNAYQKVGMFGLPCHPVIHPFDCGDHTGDQIRGFGFLHDGGTDTIFHFIGNTGFLPLDPDPSVPLLQKNISARKKLEQFVLAFDSNMAPVVGQQITLTSTNGSVAGPRIDLLKARAQRGECDLVVHGYVSGRQQGFWYRDPVFPYGNLFFNPKFQRDRVSTPALSDTALRALAAAAQQELTFTCVPPNSGRRMGIDRDLDGVLNGDE